MPLLRPFRDYDEKNVINFFSFSGQTSTSQVINKGTLVGIVNDWRNDQDPNQIIGTYGDFSTNNVQALRYGTIAQVGYASSGTVGVNQPPASSGSVYPLGLTLFDIRELDENTIPLKYNPRKAAELEACISGQAVPVVTRGLFLYSGLTGNFSAGAPIYSAGGGNLTCYPAQYTVSGATGAGFTGTQQVFYGVTNYLVGHALGGTGIDGSSFIKLEL